MTVYIVMFMCVTIDGVLDWKLDLLTTSPHDSEIQVINSATADLHTLQITTAHAKSFAACYVFTSRSLVTASNSGDVFLARPAQTTPFILVFLSSGHVFLLITNMLPNNGRRSVVCFIAVP
jgi:hypothetical protein